MDVLFPLFDGGKTAEEGVGHGTTGRCYLGASCKISE